MMALIAVDKLRFGVCGFCGFYPHFLKLDVVSPSALSVPFHRPLARFLRPLAEILRPLAGFSRPLGRWNRPLVRKNRPLARFMYRRMLQWNEDERDRRCVFCLSEKHLPFFYIFYLIYIIRKGKPVCYVPTSAPCFSKSPQLVGNEHVELCTDLCTCLCTAFLSGMRVNLDSLKFSMVEESRRASFRGESASVPAHACADKNKECPFLPANPRAESVRKTFLVKKLLNNMFLAEMKRAEKKSPPPCLLIRV